jgi:hypothetical protein
LLANRLEQRESHTKDLDAQLIGRYATGSILSRVRSVYNSASGSWDCDAEDGFLRYFLREDAAYGMSRFAIRGSYCTPESLDEVARMKRWPEVERAFIHRLNDTNLWAARDAAEVLAKFGGPNAKQAMLLRLRTFSETWKSRANELREHPNMPSDARDAISFQYGLVESLGHAQGWVLNDDEIAQTESLTLGQERENAGHWLSQSPVRLTLNISSDGRIHAQIGQYSADELPALLAKLAQFQKGTRFLLSFSGAEEQRSPVLQSINEIARLHGLTVENSFTK